MPSACDQFRPLTERLSSSATFFFQKGIAGACGKVNPESALIAAMRELPDLFNMSSCLLLSTETERYGDLSKQSSLCGQQVQITNTKNGKTVTVTIADACPTCGGPNDIDLSQGAFDQIATEEEGEVPSKCFRSPISGTRADMHTVTWKFL